MKVMYAFSGSRVESRAVSRYRVKLAPPHHDVHVVHDVAGVEGGDELFDGLLRAVALPVAPDDEFTRALGENPEATTGSSGGA